MSSPWHTPKLYQDEPGRYVGRVNGRDVEAILLGPVWAVFVDGVERFSAHSLQIAERKLAEWFSSRDRHPSNRR